ncbi:MAG: polyphenol oxidase family protein [Alphaproteobacteria bacterium]|nr:polyphenol oxidase family protein [Rickettsiales bacterium]
MVNTIILNNTQFCWRNLVSNTNNPLSLSQQQDDFILNSYVVDYNNTLDCNYGVLNDIKLFNLPKNKINSILNTAKSVRFSTLHKIGNKIGVKVVQCNQMHTNNVQEISNENINKYSASTNIDNDKLIAYDGVFTSLKGVMLTAYSSDCVTVIVRHKKPDFIGVLHSGWKGSLRGVNEAMLRALKSRGCNIGSLEVFIAPSISRDNYEVKEDLYSFFTKKSIKNNRFFSKKNGVIYFDNRSFVISKYTNFTKVTDCCIDTFKDVSFSSFRHKSQNADVVSKYNGNVSFIYL